VDLVVCGIIIVVLARWLVVSRGGHVRLGRLDSSSGRSAASEPRVTEAWIVDSGGFVPMRVIHASKEEAETGLDRLREAAAHWLGHPGLLLEDPDLALIVRVRDIHHDGDGFTVRMSVDQVIGAPEGVTVPERIDRRCGWNQPYMSFDEQGVFAPYGFYLHIGDIGAANVREFWARSGPQLGRYTSTLRGVLRGTFSMGRLDEQ